MFVSQRTLLAAFRESQILSTTPNPVTDDHFPPTAESCLVGRTVLRRPQRPSFRDSPKRFRGTLTMVHPREPPFNRQLCRDRGRLKTSHACTDGTLLQLRLDRNNKVRPRCAETVDDADCLWKVSEKMGIIFSNATEAIVPALWPFDVANALLVAERRKSDHD